MRSIERSEPRRSLLADERGGAQVEGAIVVMFFAMMFAFFLWFQHLTHVELSAVRKVGRDVWAPALEGCVSGPPAPARDWVGGFRAVQAEVAPEAASRLDDVTASDIQTSAHASAARPAALGGGSLDIERRGGTECNTKMAEGEIPWGGRVRSLFCERYPLSLNWAEGCAPD